jgi:Tfp pilus assembly protein PilF
LRLTIQAEAPAESPDETAAQYEWAIRKNPDDRVLHYNYGLFLFDHNRTAAIAQLSLSRPWDGFPVFTPDGLPVE